MKKILVLFTVLWSVLGFSQEQTFNKKTKIFKVQSRGIQVDSVSIYPGNFNLYSLKGKPIAQTLYQIDYSRARLALSDSIIKYYDSIKVQYRSLPNYLTKKYKANNEAIIIPKNHANQFVYQLNTNRLKGVKPFDGLYTSGSLSRGVTIGNNQDAVVNSNFNLQIEGKLSSKIGIRANITDNEIPLQEGGYTQRIDDFDKVFIELFSKDWSVRAGDIDLINTKSYFMPFEKKISGVAINANLNHGESQTNILASGAIVRGRYSRYDFVGIDGNQGPYRILGPSNELYVLIVSGSERVYANGVLLKRGENFDYTIDYSTGEITFTTIYPVTANVRFKIEYQILDTNYTRFLTFNTAHFKSDKLNIGVQYYLEKDSKNRPVQQDLSNEEKEVLANAGNDKGKMIVPSAELAVHDDHKILYEKINQNGEDVFIYSNDINAELYQVSFTFVGENNGDYNIETSLAGGRVYAYQPPVNGVKQGSYLPVKQLIAPESLQLLSFVADYKLGEKSDVSGELTLSNKDQNLFSAIDNDQNKGIASKLNWTQNWVDKSYQINSQIDYQYIDKNFQTIERYRNIEFQRDWNLSPILTNLQEGQQFITGVLNWSKPKIGQINYTYENLEVGELYKGNRHQVSTNISNNNIDFVANASLLNSEDQIEQNKFKRLYSKYLQKVRRGWFGAKFNYEKNQINNIINNELNVLSHAFYETEGFIGVGDSTHVFAELGYNFRSTDSVVNRDFEQYNKAHTIFLKTQLVKNKNTDLKIYSNYRKVINHFYDDENILNNRLMYRQYMFNKKVTLQTLYETQTGSLPQQEFTYVEVEPGKGFYEWIDFNDNGIQELDEFVVAKFPDQAKYVRVLLPNINFISTNKNKLSQTITLSGNQWRNQTGLKRFLSHFNNQAYFLIDKQTKREGGALHLNPFDYNDDNLLGLNLNLKNSLFYNRGLQKYSTTYTYLHTQNRSIYVFGDQDVNLKSHQLKFLHKIGLFWLFDLESKITENTSSSVTFGNRNYEINAFDIKPKIAYLYNNNTKLEGFYTYKKKDNRIDDFEELSMHNLGINFQYGNLKKITLNTNVNLYFNKFKGDTNSPVAYQMLEGLQPGTNLTWLLSLQKRLTSFLDLNIYYTGRKVENAKTIHTGSMQIRASF